MGRTTAFIGAPSGGADASERLASSSEMRHANPGTITSPGITHSYRSRLGAAVAGGVGGAGQANLAVRTVGTQAAGEFEFLAGFARLPQVEECLGRGVVERGLQLGGGKAKQATLQGDRFCLQPGDVEGNAIGRGGGAASAADRAAAKNDPGSEPGDFRLPPGLFVAGKFGHLGQMIAELRVPGGRAAEAVRGGCGCA